MITLIKVEFIKMKKNYLSLFLVVFNLLSVLIGTVIFTANRSLLIDDGNQSLVLWGQSSLFSSQIFFPILVGIICSISWQLEEKNKNWQRINSLPIKSRQFILSKFISMIIITGFSQIIFLIFFLISAVILQIPQIQFWTFILWTFFGWIGSFSIVAIQLFISVRLKNFTFPILLSAIGAIFGMVTLFISQIVFNFFPYTQVTIGMRSRLLSNFNTEEFCQFIVVTFFYSVVFLWLTNKFINKRED